MMSLFFLILSSLSLLITHPDFGFLPKLLGADTRKSCGKYIILVSCLQGKKTK
jgi:hypothetical protein